MGDRKKYSEFLKSDPDDPESCMTVQELIDRGVWLRGVPPNTGLFSSRVCKTPFSYNYPAGSRKAGEEGDAYIVLGQVPPAGKGSGYSGKGISAAAIDMVVGRQSSANDGKGPKKFSVVENNFGTDAARIYISRLCDIDQIFGLDSPPGPDGEPGGLIARSGIGIKADGVRIIGREGVKITTGRMRGGKFGQNGEPNSLGGKSEPIAPKIDLVAGNSYSESGVNMGHGGIGHCQVQGVAKGEVTRDGLRELHDIIGEIWSALYNFALVQSNLNATFGVTPIPWHAAAAPTAVLGTYAFVVNSLWQTKISANMWKLNYLSPVGKTYIVSRNVRTN
jgi:hypothetical protein